MPFQSDIVQQPVFYLFIAGTILISLGYSWGRRRNRRIFLSAFDAITSVIEPKDQQFTNIGGLTGYHANFVPHKNRYIRRLDATITMLPRQSWLYYPISRLTRKFDRLFLAYHLSPKAAGVLKEGHLIEKGYSRLAGARIENEAALTRETVDWDGMTFSLYYQDHHIRDRLEQLRHQLGTPGPLRHVALVPEQDRLFVFLIPRIGQVEPLVGTVTRWFGELVESRLAAQRQSR
ncbi:MAG: hypothetical protein EA384_12885 [Spirochaetaceae bacterium]|nr:MAG: hypothetical protein EA384_12885 [Spirochaetaceae bacterium]